GLLDFAKHAGCEVLTTLADPARYGLIRQAWKLLPIQKIELDDYFLLHLSGLLSDDSLESHLKELGFRTNGCSKELYRIFRRDRNCVADLIDERFRGTASPLSWLLRHDKAVIGPGEILEMVNRELLSERGGKYMMKQHFKGEEDLASAYMEMRNEI